MSTGKPYTDEWIDDNSFIRTFKQIGNENTWHRDKQDREITIIESSDVLFQYDNDIPFLLKKGMKLKVKKETFHRIIPKKDFKLKIFIRV